MRLLLPPIVATGLTSGSVSAISGHPEPILGWLFVVTTLAIAFGVSALMERFGA